MGETIANAQKTIGHSLINEVLIENGEAHPAFVLVPVGRENMLQMISKFGVYFVHIGVDGRELEISADAQRSRNAEVNAPIPAPASSKTH